jgi:hypothetical protein
VSEVQQVEGLFRLIAEFDFIEMCCMLAVSIPANSVCSLGSLSCSFSVSMSLQFACKVFGGEVVSVSCTTSEHVGDFALFASLLQRIQLIFVDGHSIETVNGRQPLRLPIDSHALKQSGKRTNTVYWRF